MTDDKLLEEIAKELYFEGRDYEEGSVATLTWNEGWPARKEKWLLRAGRILSKVQEHYKDCVWLADDQSLPHVPLSGLAYYNPHEVINKCLLTQQVMSSAGWRKIERGRE